MATEPVHLISAYLYKHSFSFYRRKKYQLKMASQLEKEVGSEYPKERIQEFLDVAMDLVSRASGCVKEALSKRDKNVETKSSATDLVTETDKAMEKLLVGGLQVGC